MLNIIIDGYNVIGTGHKDLKRERDLFIGFINNFASQRKHSIIIVFDGHSGNSFRENIDYFGNVKVIYTPIGSTADSFIINYIKKNRKKWLVVSSDNYIKDEAWNINCVPVDSNIFLEILSYHDYEFEVPAYLPYKRVKELKKTLNKL
ncbi:MAG TPA: hypothetical protein HPP56_07240 [Nitrospirae bacterium]|nr:hypothetical protein [Nitrospirota bacterium]